MTTLAVRIPDTLLEALDRLVAKGRYPNRTSATRTALQHLIDEEQHSEVDRAIVAGYTAHPPEPPDPMTKELAELSIRQEAW